MNKIMLDTNFLVAPFQQGFDIFEEIERLYPESKVYTLEDAVQEAKSIEEGRYVDLVEKLLETKNIEVLETEGEGEVDDLLVEICDEFVVGTNDRELKERLLDEDAEVIIVRGGNHLEVRNRDSLRH